MPDYFSPLQSFKFNESIRIVIEKHTYYLVLCYRHFIHSVLIEIYIYKDTCLNTKQLCHIY